jgi:hypothetical protein
MGRGDSRDRLIRTDLTSGSVALAHSAFAVRLPLRVRSTKHERLLRLEQATAERKLALSEEQVRLLERFSPEFRKRHIEAPHTGALVAVDTFFVGMLKVVASSTCRPRSTATVGTPGARLSPSKLPVTAVQLMNGDVLPTFEDADAAPALIRLWSVAGPNAAEASLLDPRSARSATEFPVDNLGGQPIGPRLSLRLS